MHMGADGFLWVRWDAGGSRDKETRQAETKMLVHSMFGSPMTGEISPNMMFGKNGHTGAPVGADGCAWVYMGALGCRGTGGQENKVGRRRNEQTGCVSQCVAPDKKAESHLH